MRTYLASLLIFAMVCLAHSAPAQAGNDPDASWLPGTGAVYAAETDGKNDHLKQIHAQETHTNTHAGSNFLRAQVFAGPQLTLEIKGLNAITQLATTTPILYVRITADDPELVRNRVHLIRLDQMKDTRSIGVFSQNVFGGQRKKSIHDITITKTNMGADAWLKVVPDAPLAPGEYGIVFMPSDPSQWPGAVYDFNVAAGEAKPEKK